MRRLHITAITTIFLKAGIVAFVVGFILFLLFKGMVFVSYILLGLSAAIILVSVIVKVILSLPDDKKRLP